MGVSYFGQIMMLLYLTFAIAGFFYGLQAHPKPSFAAPDRIRTVQPASSRAAGVASDLPRDND
jgi:hypothetical protein